jgi:hypothetical protein
MSEGGPEDFTCPQCQSPYKLVRVKPGPRTTNRPVHCTVCGYPLAPRDGEDVLKYFLISRSKAETPVPSAAHATDQSPASQARG